MEQLVIEVMSNIRFPMMSPRQLAELLLNPLTTKYKEFFVEKMAIGMSFHSGTYKICLKTYKFFFALWENKFISKFFWPFRIKKKLFIYFRSNKENQRSFGRRRWSFIIYSPTVHR
mgnify:CR=1 FL=1